MRKARREAGMTQLEVTKRLGWSNSRISLIERARLKVTREDAKALLDLYRLRGPDRAILLSLVDEDSAPSEADAFSWLTSHVFRKTTATILDDARQSARQIADQLDTHGPR
ncbi:helix-turn-helix domain-containing protein [Kribbella sindirgiensis]|uniref:helix-turn-helix domain-containing protein n=1 Tax=Kribbella sindirgiensis TaxID=1124744 RepID=UPI002355CDF1|nr:helix-turn-helix transcriptional regulator [Kribbella sindirgiensis]